ncbi:type IV secretory system conjugative DNA transfer family protein [Allorhizocola rhizosphaerae]|uniref:type IV secretory system conjugative DNA transfer family protein n=1 Tax=Allorhizocola rhizosphaerae TaxID=1872709 RepID=UPI000E3BF106|nr:type IV secretion system DNA-binding domain-containing protein [Allorhizocola rhizosphaerae]
MLTATYLLIGGLAIGVVVLLARHAQALAWHASLVALEVKLPSGLEVDDIANWLATVAATFRTPRWSLFVHAPVALEINASHGGVRYVLLVRDTHRGALASGLRGALPGVRTEVLENYLDARPVPMLAAEATLTSWRRQMAVDRAAGTATATLAALQPLRPGQSVTIQWLFHGAATPNPVPSKPSAHGDLPWPLREELDGEALQSARRKIADPQLHCCLRVGVTAATRPLSQKLFARVWNPHHGLDAAGVRLVRRWWRPARSVARSLAGMRLPLTTWPLLLSTRELAGLLPFPLAGTALPGVRLGSARQLPPPPGLARSGVRIGVSNYPGMARSIRLAPQDRLRHLHILGPTGTGKSTLLVNMVIQDIEAGHGLVVIDPLGDLTNNILDRVPEHRVDDVIVLNPSATEQPVGFNIMRAGHDEQSRELVVDHVIHIYHELYQQFWGPRSEDLLRGALLTLAHTRAPDGSNFTLIEVPELLTNQQFRNFVIAQATMPASLKSFWRAYQDLKAGDQVMGTGPILNKLRAVTLRTPIRLILGQETGLDLTQVLAQNKILLAPLGKPAIGSESAALLGTVLLASVWQAVLGRIRLQPNQRRPFFVYVDEAQDVLRLPIDMDDMLAQARGLGTGFVIAHQHLGQLETRQVKAALLGTVRSQIVFQTLRADATELAKSFGPHLTAEDLLGLEAFEVAARLSVGGRTISPVTATTLPLPDPVRDGQALASASRARYGRPREEVEAALAQRIAVKSDKPSTAGARRFGRQTLDNKGGES